MTDIIVQPKRFNGTDNDNLIMNTAKNLRDNSNNDIPLIVDTNRNVNIQGIISDEILYKNNQELTTSTTTISVGKSLPLNSFIAITILFYGFDANTSSLLYHEKTEFLEILDLSNQISGYPNLPSGCEIPFLPYNYHVHVSASYNDNNISFRCIDNSSATEITNIKAILKTIRFVKM